MLFAVLGAPIVIDALRYTSVYFKNMISINLNLLNLILQGHYLIVIILIIWVTVIYEYYWVN